MSIYITGDTHGDFSRFLDPRFTDAAGSDKFDYMIVTGDFGAVFYGTEEEEKKLDMLERKAPFTLLFVDGNHENFDLLKRYPVEKWNDGDVQFIRPHIIHLMRGNCYTIENHTFFAMGGARSSDITDGILEMDSELLSKVRCLEADGKRLYRIKGMDWFPEEVPSEDELKKGILTLAAHGCKVDYILTHAAPKQIAQYLLPGEKNEEEWMEYFEIIRKNVKFQTWYCGHYHRDEDVVLDGKMYRILYHRILKIC